MTRKDLRKSVEEFLSNCHYEKEEFEFLIEMITKTYTDYKQQELQDVQQAFLEKCETIKDLKDKLLPEREKGFF